MLYKMFIEVRAENAVEVMASIESLKERLDVLDSVVYEPGGALGEVEPIIIISGMDIAQQAETIGDWLEWQVDRIDQDSLQHDPTLIDFVEATVSRVSENHTTHITLRLGYDALLEFYAIPEERLPEVQRDIETYLNTRKGETLGCNGITQDDVIRELGLKESEECP